MLAFGLPECLHERLVEVLSAREPGALPYADLISLR